jgi:predicted nucleic acid-binding protein
VIFLDTNVVSETIRPVPNTKVLRWIEINDPLLNLTTVTLAEVAFGIKRIRPPERPKRLEGFVATLQKRFQHRLYGFDEHAAVVYGELMGAAHLEGRNLSTADGMIAAIAMRHGASLATRNVKDFAGLDLRVIDPWSG